MVQSGHTVPYPISDIVYLNPNFFCEFPQLNLLLRDQRIVEQEEDAGETAEVSSKRPSAIRGKHANSQAYPVSQLHTNMHSINITEKHLQ